MADGVDDLHRFRGHVDADPVAWNDSDAHRLIRAYLLIGHLPDSGVGCVYLRPLEASAEIDVYGLPFGKHIERGGASLAMTVAGCLGSPTRKMDLCANRRRVDIEDACVKVAHCGKRTVD